LIQAKLCDDWRDIYTSTTGAVFIGTPHHGTGPITSEGIKNKLTAANYEVEDVLLRPLAVGDDTLLDLRKEFTSLINKPPYRLPVNSFYEQISSQVGKVIGDPTMKVSINS
jgi:hypothetical protein